MALPIEDYALIGDTHTAALVGRDGSLDWLCAPRFDSQAAFAALLGTADNGRWLVGPTSPDRRGRRRYRDATLILETDFEAAGGAVRLIDFMPVRLRNPRVVRVVRIVEGLHGTVAMHTRLKPRFDYGHIMPWAHRNGDSVTFTAGPDALEIRGTVRLAGHDYEHSADFTIGAGERQAFVLSAYPSWEPPPAPIDPYAALAETESFWTRWSTRSTYAGGWPDEVQRSLVTLKALTYEPTGGIVAAPTTSLPELVGGVRNWDYRYCWLRDAALTLAALLSAGYVEEATRWRDWLLRAVAGDPEDLQIMYGLAGERRLDEYELDWLPGYEGSRPVRVGNAACGQLQLDVYGETLDALDMARRLGMAPVRHGEPISVALMDWLESNWRRPDDGIWEVRGPRRHFVHSKVMAWVAADRVVRMAGAGWGPTLARFRGLRDEIHAEVCREGFDPERNTFTQSYGSPRLDAALLLIPKVGFLPASDPRVAGTVEAVRRELVRDGFVMRYIPDDEAADGLPPGEGAFLPCSFWLVDALAMLGRAEEARAMFERLLAVRNDVGLYSEEFDPRAGRQVGNFPQAFTHLALIGSAAALSGGEPGSPALRAAGRD